MDSHKRPMKLLYDTIRQRLLSSCIGNYLSIGQLDTQQDLEKQYVIEIKFSKLMNEMIVNGCSLLWRNNFQKLNANYHNVSRDSKRNYLSIHVNENLAIDSLCIDITPDTTGEELNVVLALLIQYIQDDVLEFSSHVTSSIDMIQRIKGNVDYKKVLITGSAGWLGQFVFQDLLYQHHSYILPNGSQHGFEWIVYGTYHNQVPHWIIPSRRLLLDLINHDNIYSVIESVRPDVIIHLAAVSSPMKCHQTPELAMKMNCPTYLISAVQNICPDCLFVFASTDMVYDGNSPPYRAVVTSVTDTVDHYQEQSQPVNVYGESKLAFEHCLMNAATTTQSTPHKYINHIIHHDSPMNDNHPLPSILSPSPPVTSSPLSNVVILRLSNMIGAPYVYASAGEKFLQFLFNAYNNSPRTYLGLKRDEIRSFVYVQDVVKLISCLINDYIQRMNTTRQYHHHHHHHPNKKNSNQCLDVNINDDDDYDDDSIPIAAPLSSSSLSSSSSVCPANVITNRTINENNDSCSNNNYYSPITILNVGGPVGLSRLQVADILCHSQGSRLNIHHHHHHRDINEGDVNNDNDDDDEWTVYIVDNATATPPLITTNTPSTTTTTTTTTTTPTIITTTTTTPSIITTTTTTITTTTTPTIITTTTTTPTIITTTTSSSSCSSGSAIHNNSGGDGQKARDVFQSPRDITMMSTDTEEYISRLHLLLCSHTREKDTTTTAGTTVTSPVTITTTTANTTSTATTNTTTTTTSATTTSTTAINAAATTTIIYTSAANSIAHENAISGGSNTVFRFQGLEEYIGECLHVHL